MGSRPFSESEQSVKNGFRFHIPGQSGSGLIGFSWAELADKKQLFSS
jgi:hypothetical protein